MCAFTSRPVFTLATRGSSSTSVQRELGFIWRKWDFWFAASPVNTSNTFLYDALDLLEHVGVLFIDPVGQVAAIVQDLIEWKGGQE